LPERQREDTTPTLVPLLCSNNSASLSRFSVVAKSTVPNPAMPTPVIFQIPEMVGVKWNSEFDRFVAFFARLGFAKS
jgi:hypothetical protein